MSRPDRPAVPRRVALVAALALVPAAVPAAAAADPVSANTWAGGSVSRERSPTLGSAYAARGALVSMVTTSTRARLFVSIRSPRCVANGTLRGTVALQPGGVGEQLALRVVARRTVTTLYGERRSRARIAVSLAPAAPGDLAGTVTARGRTTTAGGGSRSCVLRERVRLRSRTALTAPLAPLSVDRAALRTGIVEQTIAPKVRGSIAIVRRTDGAFHALWTVHERCVSGPKRTADDYVNVAKRFRVAADGSFRGREVFVDSGRRDGGHFRQRFVATIRGRFLPDGTVRGTVTADSRLRETGFSDLVCTSPASSFVAAP